MPEDPTKAEKEPAVPEYVEQKHQEIRAARDSNNLVEYFRGIKEVERFKLDYIAKAEAKEGEKITILGRGLEYTVYDKEDSRIQKRHNTPQEQNDILLSWVIDDENRRRRIIESINVLIETSLKIIRTLLQEKKIPAELLGNPIFEDEGTGFTQHKVMPLEAYIESHSLEENKKVIEEYILLMHNLWRSGVCDSTFKFMENCGMNGTGDLVQLDFGEFAFTKQKVISLIQNQKWLQQNYRFVPEGELKEYIKKRFSEEFSIEKLDKYWPEEFGGDPLEEDRKKWWEQYEAYSKSWD